MPQRSAGQQMLHFKITVHFNFLFQNSIYLTVSNAYEWIEKTLLILKQNTQFKNPLLSRPTFSEEMYCHNGENWSFLIT